MNIKRLRYFCTVVECGSVSKAAQVLHLSQPPLSKRLQELEAETGVPLLARQGNKIRADRRRLVFLRARAGNPASYRPA